MDIGQTFFYSENILSTAPVQHLSQKTCYTKFPAPPPPRISTWISIIVALVSKCSCGRLSLRVTDQNQLKTSPELWLADCRRFASDEIYLLSSLISSVLELPGLPGPVYPICAQRWHKTPFISFRS